MKEFEQVQFDPEECLRETRELSDWLSANPSLKEREHILPFFKARKQLSVYLASYHQDVVHHDLLAFEYDLFGDFTSDLVAGDSRKKAYAFIEFEDAVPDSIFVKKRRKATPEWASRFERGFSQMIDWFFKLHDESTTGTFKQRFGDPPIDYIGLLVIGRTQLLGPREEKRLRWRQQFVQVNSKPIYCKTFDQLCEDLLYRLEKYSPTTKAEDKGEGAESKGAVPPTEAHS